MKYHTRPRSRQHRLCRPRPLGALDQVYLTCSPRLDSFCSWGADLRDVADADAYFLTLSSCTPIVLAPGRSFPKATPTRVRSSPTEQTFWRLDAIYVAWLLRAAPAAEYMRQAREHGLAVGFVSVMERKGIVDWLEGKADNHERIVPLEGMT